MQGLALEGGGAKGSYHIGAYKAIIDMGIDIKGIAGTSVGALNGAMLVQGDFEKAYDMWYNMSYSKVIKADDEEIEKLKNRKFSKDDISNIFGKIKAVVEDKGLDITPLKNLLKGVIDEERIRNSGKDFGIVTVSVTDKKPLELYIEDIPQGKLVDYLIASAYFPAFKTDTIDGKKFIDGGIYNNLPIGLLSNKGYKNIIAVRTFGIGRVKKIDDEGLNIIYISPNDDLGKTLDFDTETARRNLQLGYYDGLRAFKGYKGEKYYIESKKDEEFFIQYLLNLGEKRILEIGKILGFEDIPYRRCLFEFIIPKLNSMLDIKNEDDYEDIMIAFLEALALKYNIERFKIYSYDEFMDEVFKKHRDRKPEERGSLEKIVSKVDILSMFTKEQIIDRVGDILTN